MSQITQAGRIAELSDLKDFFALLEIDDVPHSLDKEVCWDIQPHDGERRHFPGLRSFRQFDDDLAVLQGNEFSRCEGELLAKERIGFRLRGLSEKRCCQEPRS